MTIRVILADDHQVIRDGLSAIMSSAADIHVVGTAADGCEALELARIEVPDVMVIDINMPNLNGIEATRQIHESLPKINVVILSMHSNKEHVYQALKAGALGYLIKDSSGIEVADAIRTVFKGQRYLSGAITESIIDAYIDQRDNAPSVNLFDELSGRERQVMQLIVEGKSSAEAAEVLSLSISTVNTYRSRLMRKLEVNDLPGLVKLAIENDLI
ncbi:MAG: response regulator transcription factor [Anaerolineales bacterium]|nr:response regulator transcription factor [Anaerolineales bacterium]